MAGSLVASARGAGTLEPLLSQLREFGVDGDDHELEALLDEACLDARRALNLFFDRGGHVVPIASEDEEHALTTAAMPAEADRPLRSRDRRRAQRHGADAALAGRGAAPSQPPQQPSGHSRYRGSEGGADGRRHAAAAEVVTGCEQTGSSSGSGRGRGQREQVTAEAPPARAGHAPAAIIRYAGPYDGITYEVDARSMTQLSTVTGEVRELRRRKPDCWAVKVSSRSFHRTGWSPLPKEVSRGLESDYLLLAKRQSTEGDGHALLAASAPESTDSQLDKLLEQEAQTEPGTMPKEQMDSALQLALQEAARDRRQVAPAVRLIERLAGRQGLSCSAADARHAALLVGSMALLQAVLKSNASMQLLGAEVFDQRYASLKFNTAGRKDAVRSLLARGMTLGPHAPPSKLLRKVEADSVPLWESRFFDAMLRAHPQLPDCTVARIRVFLSGPPRLPDERPSHE